VDQKPRPNDELYLEILRSMSPAQRLLKAFELTETARKLFRIGLRQRFPEKSESEIQEIICEAIAGMSQFGLLKKAATALDRLGVPFMLTGSHVASLQGEPRMTHDIDIVVDIQPDQIDALIAEFPPLDYYLNRGAIEQALSQRGMFNVIDIREGDKIDFWLLTEDAFDRSRFARRQRIDIEGVAVAASSPEDTIVMKLRWGRDAGGSERHYRDALRVYQLQQAKLDLEYLERWIRALRLTDDWIRLRAEANVDS